MKFNRYKFLFSIKFFKFKSKKNLIYLMRYYIMSKIKSIQILNDNLSMVNNHSFLNFNKITKFIYLQQV